MQFVLLDLYCKAGGCAKGYQDAGFVVIGVDIEPQPNYCGDGFIQMCALDALRILLAGECLTDNLGRQWRLSDFCALHASPPCQFNLKGLNAANRARGRTLAHVDLIPQTRDLLKETGLPYMIENVYGARLHNPTMLCGSMFHLQVRRHRYFESNLFFLTPPCNHSIWQEAKYPTNYRPNGKIVQSKVVQVYGNTAGSELWAEAMGINWMTRSELQQAIPPVYTECLGGQLMQVVINGLGPRFLTPSGVAETGQRGGRKTQEALARLHSGRSLSRSQPCAAEGGARSPPLQGRLSRKSRRLNEPNSKIFQR